MKLQQPSKGPLLVSIDCRDGILRRYQKRFDTSGAGLGWQLACVNEAKAGPEVLPVLGGLDGRTLVEQFRQRGWTTVIAEPAHYGVPLV